MDLRVCWWRSLETAVAASLVIMTSGQAFGQSTVEQISSSTAAYDTIRPEEQITLSEEEATPTKPPSSDEIEAASQNQQTLYKMLEREYNAYLGAAESFREDIRQLILVRYQAEKDRIAGHYDRNIRELEVQERQRRIEAIARFEEFLKKYPDDPFYTPDAMFRLAELYFERSSDEYLARTKGYEKELAAFERGERAEEPPPPKPSFAETIALYNDLLTRFPDYRHADAARYLLGYSYEEMDQRPEALGHYQILVANHPNSKFIPEVWTRIGEIYFDENKDDSLDKASQAYAKVLAFKDSPYYDKALYKLAWTYYRMDKLDPAVTRFIELVDYADQQKKVTGKSGSELRTEAIQYIAISLADDKWGGLNRAKEVLGPIADKEYTGELWKRYGEILFDQTKYPEAIEVLRMSIARYPNAPQNPEVQAKIVAAYERMRDFEGAARAREELVKNYDEGSQWFAANQSNREAIATARELTEKSLYTAAIFHHQQAQAFKKADRAAEATASYRRASENYRIYLARFPDSKNAYDFNFFLAECLYYSDDYTGAAEQYARVRDSTLDNRHLPDAALSAVIALEKEIEREETAGKLPKLELKKGAERKGEKVQPKELAPIRMDLVKASDRFVSLLPQNERAPAVAYRAAEMFYKHDQLDEARKRFEQVIIGYPDSEVAKYSANLIIESYLAVEDWDNVEKWSQRLIEIAQKGSAPSAEDQKSRDEFVESLKKFKVGARFKKAEELDAKGEYEAAANTYVMLVDENPEHEFADKALFNAAIDYEKVNRFDAASKNYQRIVDQYPKSDLADRALFRVGVNYEKGFDFPAAISAYTKLVERYPNSQHRADSLYNVAVTLENMQQYGQAAVAFKRYATTFPDREDSGEVFYRSALVYEKMEAWPEVINTLQSFIQSYSKNPKLKERMVEAYKRMGDAYAKQDKGPKAVAAFNDCLKEYRRRGFGPQDKPSADAAQCQLELAEDEFRKYDAVKIEGTGKKQAEALKKKAQLQRQIEQAYTEVFKYKRAEQTLAALYRIGHSYERFAESMFVAEVPPEFQKNEELANEYKLQLEEKAAVLERKAESAYRKAYEEAKKTRVTNIWTQRILEGLNKYKPEEFPVQKEGKGAMQTVTITGHGLDGGDAAASGGAPKGVSASSGGQP
jgi:cellulose synthase operon protein C